MEIWNNKTRNVNDLPFAPYLYSEKIRHDIHYNATQENVKFISDLKTHSVFKYHFDSAKEVRMFTNDDSMEGHMPYIHRTAIDKPNFFLSYPNTFDLKIMYLDIEVETTGKFPKPETNKIISIGYAVNEGIPIVLKIKNKNETDVKILQQFLNDLREINPDVIATFYGNYFDIPYIVERLSINNQSTAPFTRLPEAEDCYFLDNDNNKKIYIVGRVMFDIYDEATKDQTLFGSPSRKMKDIAKWFKLDKTIKKRKGFENYEIITEDLTDTQSLIGTDELDKYMISDVLITRELCNIYLPNIISMSEILQLPLNITAQRTPSTIAKIFYARELKQKDIISDAPNYKRYPEIFGVMETVIKRGKEVTVFVGGTKFQGAIVIINKKFQGKIIKPIHHIDFAGLYPNIIFNFKLSPESVMLLEEKDFIDGTFNLEDFGDYYELEFSDNRINKNLKVRVIKDEGFLPISMRKFMDAREKIKKILKSETDYDKKNELTSKSWGYKVLANSCGFGVNGSGFFGYGTATVAYTITAIGRFLITHVINKLDNHHIEVDTDGIYTDLDIDPVKLSKDLNDYIKEKIGFETNFRLEKNTYKSGYFMKMKNYVLIDQKDNLVKHGVSFKASSKNSIFSTALDKIARTMLQEPEKLEAIAIECYNYVDKADISEFIQRTTINRPLKEYSSQPKAGKKGCLQVQVGGQSEKFHDSPVVVGDSISYAKTYTGYTIKEILKYKDIDRNYYKKQIISVLKRFNLTDIEWKVQNQTQNLLTSF